MKLFTVPAVRALWERVMPVQRGGFPVMKGFMPGLGHAVSLHRDGLAVLRRAYEEQGPLVYVSLGPGQWYLFCFGAETFELLRHRAVGVAGSRDSLLYLLGGSLMDLDGAEHRKVRALMNPTFSPRGLAESSAAAICRETVQHHVRTFLNQGGGDVRRHTQQLTIEVIFRIVGVESAALGNWRAHYRKALWGLIPLTFYEGPGSPRAFALRATAWINEELRQLIHRAARETGSSLIHSLVRAQAEEGGTLSEDDLVANLRLLFLAGHETTATTLSWALIHLAERPELLRRMADEVAATGGEPPLTLADAKKLPLCEAVFRESVRLYGPAWFLERKLLEETVVNGVCLPAGTVLGLVPLLWARDAQVYSDPERFQPERWLGTSHTPTQYELAQFGGGSHFCLGYHLAWLESVQYLASLASALAAAGKRLRLVGGERPKVVLFPMPRPSPSPRIVLEG